MIPVWSYFISLQNSRFRPLSGGHGRLIGGGLLIEGQFKVNGWERFRDFEQWPLNRGWSLKRGQLYRGSTVVTCIRSFSKCAVFCRPLQMNTWMKNQPLATLLSFPQHWLTPLSPPPHPSPPQMTTIAWLATSILSHSKVASHQRWQVAWRWTPVYLWQWIGVCCILHFILGVCAYLLCTPVGIHFNIG